MIYIYWTDCVHEVGFDHFCRICQGCARQPFLLWGRGGQEKKICGVRQGGAGIVLFGAGGLFSRGEGVQGPQGEGKKHLKEEIHDSYCISPLANMSTSSLPSPKRQPFLRDYTVSPCQHLPTSLWRRPLPARSASSLRQSR